MLMAIDCKVKCSKLRSSHKQIGLLKNPDLINKYTHFAPGTPHKEMNKKCNIMESKAFLRRRNNTNNCGNDDSSDEDLDFNKPLKTFCRRRSKRSNDNPGSSRRSQLPKFTSGWCPEDTCRPVIDEAPVFYPSEEEFKDTLGYIASIRKEAEKYGMCRIVPPPSWKPPCPLKEENFWNQIKFTTRIQQVDKLQNREPMRKKSRNQCQRKRKRRNRLRFGMTRRRRGTNASEVDDCDESDTDEKFGFQDGSKYTLEKFEKYANLFKKQYFDIIDNSENNGRPSIEEIEGEYWRIVEKPSKEVEVLYGADLETAVFGSGFPKASSSSSKNVDEYVLSGWNLNNLPRLSGSVLSFESEDISGVLVPWLYIGMCFSSFCWHVEDHHLYSLNYMHFGDPKIWYGVPSYSAAKFEDAMKKHLPDLFEEQPGLLHDLVTQLSPTVLKSEGVSVYRAIQKSGEFVLTFPRGYHSGFNCGFNCAEAVNVAPVDWLPYGQSAIELYSEQKRKTSVSHDKLLFGVARKAVKALWEITMLNQCNLENLKWEQICCDGVLTSAVKARVMMENERRGSLSSKYESKKFSENIDSMNERECFSCFYDLDMSAACCPCSPNRFSCLTHAKDLCSCISTPKHLLFRYTLDELNSLVQALEGDSSAIQKCATEIFKIDSHLNYKSSVNQQCDISMAKSEPLIKKDATDATKLYDSKASLSSSHSSEASSSSTKLFGIDLNDSKINSCNLTNHQTENVVNIVKHQVEPLSFGTIKFGKHWCNKEAIFPKGFRSRIQFLSVLDPTRTCYYISEILDAGLLGPMFKVTLEECPDVMFVNSSAMQCWEMVRERVNSEITRQQSLRNQNISPLQPLDRVNGLEMFGLLSPDIVKVIEDLDPNYGCSEYWSSKTKTQPISKSEPNHPQPKSMNRKPYMLFGIDIAEAEPKNNASVRIPKQFF